MNRRHFFSAAGIALASPAFGSKPASNQYVVLSFIELHNGAGNQRRRLTQFLQHAHLPASRRAGIAPVGYFQVYLGSEMPRIVTVSAYDSLSDFETKQAALRSDEEWLHAVEEVSAQSPVFDRRQEWLLRTFDALPRVETPKIESGRKPRFFDLRIYESESLHKGDLKVEMFNSGEIDIFRETGLNPVFFGQTLFGAKMPNLAYMVWYDDWAARQAAWDKFRTHPKWKKMSSNPRWKGVVSNITNTFLQPLPFSPIR